MRRLSFLPVSATSELTAISGLAGVLGVSLWLNRSADLSSAEGTTLLLLACLVPLAIVDFFFFKSFRNPSSGLQSQGILSMHWGRVGLKFLGLLVTLGVLSFLYVLLPVYRSAAYFENFTKLVYIIGPYLFLASLVYFPVVDSLMKEPEDGYFHLGLWVLGRWKRVDGAILKAHLKAWAVKGFFMPIMLGLLVGSTDFLMKANLNFPSFREFFEFTFRYLYLIDLAFGALGYVMTLRLFDSHIRSVEPTVLGWVVALSCYTPFQDNLTEKYLHYEDGFFWGDLFQQNSLPYILWGSAILLLQVVYVWATVSFGLRFSNLTHRGIITSGPYRWMKHPAYVCKNLMWWMISIPFISKLGWWSALQNSLLLLGVNFIYFMRAKTEEAHLSLDPVYRAYREALLKRRARLFRGR